MRLDRGVAEEARLRREMRMVIRKARERRAMSQADFALALGDLLGRRVTA
jgi:ribosome-binding protein aMBF1 (putative translation factor)